MEIWHRVLPNSMDWNRFNMSNLRLLNETSVTSGVASVSVTDVFTDDFDVYKIVFTDMEIETESCIN